jgi:hypothetical protein
VKKGVPSVRPAKTAGSSRDISPNADEKPPFEELFDEPSTELLALVPGLLAAKELDVPGLEGGSSPKELAEPGRESV